MKEKQFVNKNSEKHYSRIEDCPDIDFSDPEVVINLPESLNDFSNEEEKALQLNNRIKELRHENGLTQMDMAQILRVKHKQYWLYEQIGYNMNIEKLAQIAMFYNVSIDWLSGFCDVRKPFGAGDENTEYEVNGFVLSFVKQAKEKGTKISDIQDIQNEI